MSLPHIHSNTESNPKQNAYTPTTSTFPSQPQLSHTAPTPPPRLTQALSNLHHSTGDGRHESCDTTLAMLLSFNGVSSSCNRQPPSPCCCPGGVLPEGVRPEGADRRPQLGRQCGQELPDLDGRDRARLGGAARRGALQCGGPGAGGPQSPHLPPLRQALPSEALSSAVCLPATDADPDSAAFVGKLLEAVLLHS